MNWTELIRFKVLCESDDVAVPPPILRCRELADVIASHDNWPTGSLLSLTDEEARERVTEMSIRSHQGAFESSRGMRPGISTFTDELLLEVREAALPYLDAIVLELRPKFEELAAPVVTAAQKYGFTRQTKSDQVIDLADEAASAAWRANRDAWTAVAPISRLRIAISDVFNVSPTETDQVHALAGFNQVDHSACFAAGNSWSLDGAYYVNRKVPGQIDWLALAVGGLTLNTPDEVRQKYSDKSAAQRALSIVQ
jgi:hypothetical protein